MALGLRLRLRDSIVYRLPPFTKPLGSAIPDVKFSLTTAALERGDFGRVLTALVERKPIDSC